MNYKRSHDGSDTEPTVPKRKLDEIHVKSQTESQPSHDNRLPPMPSMPSSSSATMTTSHSLTIDHKHVVHNRMAAQVDAECLMDCCEAYKVSDVTNDNNSGVKHVVESMATTSSEPEDDDDCDTDPDIIIPYLKRFQDSYQSSLNIYSSRLEKLELSDALKCTNDLFAVAIDNYQKEHNGFTHKTSMDMSGILNIRREFDTLLAGGGGLIDEQHNTTTVNNGSNSMTNITVNMNSMNDTSIKITISDNNGSNALSDCTNYYFNRLSNKYFFNNFMFDEKLAKVISFMCQIEAKICCDMKQIYCSYERLLEALVMIEYRLAIIIEMFHHMTDVEPQKFLPCLPFIQNVPDLIGYINSLYDAENELQMRDETCNERMQAIVDQFRAMHKRIRDAMDGLHALSCIIMEKKTEVIDRVHTFYKKAEQIFFSQPPFVFQTKNNNTNRCL